MLNSTIKTVLLTSAFITVTSSAFAVAPGETVNPNGFPSGPHFNLNILGKKADFVCPNPVFDEYGNQVYGNVVFIPENALNVPIYMESGQKGPRSAPTITELQVTDWCAGFSANDSARIRLPKWENGYNVYARVLAKPTDNPEMSISPELVSVVDEYGNDLLYLGFVTDGGFATTTVPFVRQKGKSIATDITGLFEWSGTVCTLDVPQTTSYYTSQMCIQYNADGTIAWAVQPTLDPITNLLTCPEGSLLTTIFCVDYQDQWVFNIASFVDYMWDIDNNGVKNLQVRFYPVQ